MSETYINLITEESVEADRYREYEEGSNNLDLIQKWAESHKRIFSNNEWLAITLGAWLVYDDEEFVFYPNYLFERMFIQKPISKPESNLVKHARTELELIGEEPGVIEGYLNVIQAFADMGHSGGSASVAIPTINALLQYQNLRPLTNDPNEWFNHGPNMGGDDGADFWQSKRNSKAFSHDGGKTYYLLSEGAHNGNREPMHTSEEKK